MDQQKIQRMLRLLMKLSGRRWCSLLEISGILECSERTVYRYLETFETAGFILEKEQRKLPVAKRCRFHPFITKPDALFRGIALAKELKADLLLIDEKLGK